MGTFRTVLFLSDTIIEMRLANDPFYGDFLLTLVISGSLALDSGVDVSLVKRGLRSKSLLLYTYILGNVSSFHNSGLLIALSYFKISLSLGNDKLFFTVHTNSTYF